MPSAMSLRASSRFSRARLSGTSGYAPSEISFLAPLTRYFRRHRRPPVGVHEQEQAALVVELEGFSRGFARRELLVSLSIAS